MNINSPNNSNNTSSLRAVLFKSNERFIAFKKKLENHDVDVTVLDFEEHAWLQFDYSDIDFFVFDKQAGRIIRCSSAP